MPSAFVSPWWAALLVVPIGVSAIAGCGSCPEPDTAADAKEEGAPPPADELVEKADKLLDGWHEAAARADINAYFGAFDTEGVFLGTDATERWDVAAFRAYAKPHFDRGSAWSFRATRRHISVGPDRQVVWFDEDLETEGLGPARGSGVLRWVGGELKIAQYNLALTIPNERFDAVREVLEREE